MAELGSEEQLFPCVDCHVHIAASEFDEDIAEVIEGAKKTGVVALVGVTEFKGDFSKLLDLSERYPDVIAPCLGIHPVQSLRPDRSVTMEDLQGVEEIIRQNKEKLVAIGEVGLDFTPRFIKSVQDKETQREVFRKQVALALELDLPLNCHSRSAGRHVIAMLKEQGVQKALLHAFDGRASVALDGVKEGYYFSVPPSVVRSEQKQKLVKQLPLSNLLLETDSPALAAEKQTRNEPKNISISCKAIADIKGIPLRTVYEETTKNALKLFPKLNRFLRK